MFVLGAGFSAAAGIPLTNELIKDALTLFSAECPGIYRRVEGYAKEATGILDGQLELSNLSFSDLCTFLEFIELREYGGGERWHENGSREKLALRFYLAKVLVKRTPAPDRVPDLYRAFAEQLQENDVVISLNWDGLLEAAMDAVGKARGAERLATEHAARAHTLEQQLARMDGLPVALLAAQQALKQVRNGKWRSKQSWMALRRTRGSRRRPGKENNEVRWRLARFP